MTISKQQSDTLWELKAFFIFTVIFAHMPMQGDGLLAIICRYIGVVGVPCFLLMSGYFDYGSKRPLWQRIKNLLVPLLIWGSLTFIIDLIPKVNQGIEWGGVIKGWALWVYGCGTWLYFVPMLMWCMVLNRYVNKWVLIGIALAFTAIGVDLIPYNNVLTPYINPFNLIIYFMIGRLAREYKWQFDDRRLLIPAIIICIVSLAIWNERLPHYVNLCCIPFCVSVFVLAYYVFSNIHASWLIWIGKVSFVIYFCHMQIGGKVNSLFSSYCVTEFEIVKYPIAFCVIVFFVFFLEKLLKLLPMDYTKSFGFRS